MEHTGASMKTFPSYKLSVVAAAICASVGLTMTGVMAAPP
jgi:hypothetical protein